MNSALAGMTPEERQTCEGMWAEWVYGDGQMALVVIEEIHPVRDFAVCAVPGVRYVEIPRHQLSALFPRHDLHRVRPPDGTPVPVNVGYDIQGYRETTDEWVDFFGTRQCTLRKAKRDLAEAREDEPNIKWRLGMRHESHFMAIPDDYQEPGVGDYQQPGEYDD